MTGFRAIELSLDLAGRRVLTGLSLAFERGRITAVLGPNGAGKSSLLACLAGLRRPSAGAALLDGVPILDVERRERARRIGFLPQAQDVHWDVDVRTLVGLGRLPHRARWSESAHDKDAVETAMAETDVLALAERAVGTLSGGELGRALVARVLAGEPEWLLVDEPLASLDPAHQLDLLRLLRASADCGRGVILVVHDLQLAQRIADDAVLLRQGRVLAAGPAHQVFNPDRISEAFGVAVEIVRSAGGRPLILPAMQS